MLNDLCSYMCPISPPSGQWKAWVQQAAFWIHSRVWLPRALYAQAPRSGEQSAAQRQGPAGEGPEL